MSIPSFFSLPLFDMAGPTGGGPSGKTLYMVTYSRTLTGGGFQAHRIVITPPDDPKDVYQIEFEVELIDSSDDSVVSTSSATFFRAAVNVNNGHSAPIRILPNSEFALILPCIEPDHGNPANGIVHIKTTFTFDDNTQHVVETSITEYESTTEDHITYFAGNNQSGSFPTRPDGPFEVSITNVVPGENGVGMMIDWSSDMEVGGFTVFGKFDIDTQNQAKGQSVTGVDYVSGEILTRRPIEVLLPYPSAENRPVGQAYNFRLTAEFFLDGGGDPIAVLNTSGVYNILQNAPANLPNMDFDV
ncbi:MAG: hypothetical protein SF052_04505 [Bacteroidia bacterium]|nr:hypothetical protein [Bacteroidia bacterium]